MSRELQLMRQKMPLPFSLRSTLSGETMILHSEIAADNLLSGNYCLYLYSEELNSQLKAYANTSFVTKERSG